MRSIRVLPGESSHTHRDEKNILPLQNELTKLTELTKPGSVSCVSAYRRRLADVSAEFGSAHGSHKTTRPASIKDRRSKQRSADSEGARIRLPLCTALRTLLRPAQRLLAAQGGCVRLVAPLRGSACGKHALGLEPWVGTHGYGYVSPPGLRKSTSGLRKVLP